MLSKLKSAKFFLPDRSVLFALFICSLMLSPHKSFALNQSEITAAMRAGWNLGNQLEANINGTPSETAWSNPTITPRIIQLVKSAGFKSIRIPVSYLNKIGAAPNYTIDSRWLARVKEVVDYCINENLYVMINVHGDGYNTVTGGWLLVNGNNQSAIKEKYGKVWQQIATYFKNYDEHLIFESMNEVFDGGWSDPNRTYYSNLNAYNQIFVDVVRQTGGNNASRWLLIPGWNTDINYTANNYGFVLPTDTHRASSIPGNEKRIMISVHYYSPWGFCGEESGTATQWGKNANSSKKDSWGQEDFMDSQLKLMNSTFVTKGYPVVIGEWGSVDKTRNDASNNTFREYFAKTFVSYCKKYGAVPVYWDNGANGSYGFGLFDRSSFRVTQQGIINAIMSSIPTATSNPKILQGNAPELIAIKDLRREGTAISIDIQLNRAEQVGISAYDLSGNSVWTIASKRLTAGSHRFNWNAGTIPNGYYLIELRAGEKSISCKAYVQFQ